MKSKKRILYLQIFNVIIKIIKFSLSKFIQSLLNTTIIFKYIKYLYFIILFITFSIRDKE